MICSVSADSLLFCLDPATGELLDESVLLDGILSTYALMTTGGRLSSSFVADQLAGQAAYHLDVIDALANMEGAPTEADRAQALMRELESLEVGADLAGRVSG